MEEIKQFNQTIEINCYSKSTIKSYKFHIKKFLSYYHNDLRQENIEKHLYYLKTKRNYSPESLNLARASLIYFFNKIKKILYRDFYVEAEKEFIIPEWQLKLIEEEINSKPQGSGKLQVDKPLKQLNEEYLEESNTKESDNSG